MALKVCISVGEESLGSLVCGVFLCFCHFPMWCQMWYLILSIPDLCLLTKIAVGPGLLLLWKTALRTVESLFSSYILKLHLLGDDASISYGSFMQTKHLYAH